MTKFIECAKLFKTGQMGELRKLNFFTKAKVREGLKRYIHIKYIECI